MNNKKTKGERIGKKTISLFEIFILIISIIALAYFIGDEFEIVSATGPSLEVCKTGKELTIDGNTWKKQASNQWECIKGPGCSVTGVTIKTDEQFCTDYSAKLNPSTAKCENKVVKCFETATTPGTCTIKMEGKDFTINSGESGCDTLGLNNWGCQCTQGTKSCTKTCNKGKMGNCVCTETANTNKNDKISDILTPLAIDKLDKLLDEEKGNKNETKPTDNTGLNGTKPTDNTGFFGLGTLWGNVVEGFIWAVGVYTVSRFVLDALGAEDNLVTAGSLALGLGVLAYKTTYGILGGKGNELTSGLVGAGTALLVFALTYNHETQEVISFSCLPWQAATGGNYCQRCNEQGILPCTEYQCRSLGQACQLLNKGTTQEKCAWVNQNDVDFPTIEPWESVLTEGYVYTPDNQMSPPDRGVFIELQSSSTGCVKAFTPLTFGVTTNEPAKCKLDVLRKNSFDEMGYFFSGGLSLQNHSYLLSLPGVEALEAEGVTIENDGNYNLYVRCQDANGNSNTADFVFKFCVEKGPDTTPPLISGTSIPNKSPIAAGQLSVENLQVYINEPVDGCSWSHLDQVYENMENPMDCTLANSIADMNERGLYTCTTTLDGLKDREENKFYFRCVDLSGNSNKESFEYTLIGTQPLVIDWVEPNGTVKDSTERVKVTLKAHTSAGYSDGKAVCSFRDDNAGTGNYIDFFYGDAELYSQFEHSQELLLPEGIYQYSIKCIDRAGNADTQIINFNVDSDTEDPIAIRVYHEENNLKIITDKPARCVYDTKDCSYNFDKGIEMTVIDEINHYTAWNTDTNFYIKCRDENGNQPDPDQCTITVRPLNKY